MTSVGKVLQKTKRELPHLWNVVRGNMSLVGPRPETIDFADCFRCGYDQVLQYKPGIFGPTQVFVRNESEVVCPEMDPETYYREVLLPVRSLCVSQRRDQAFTRCDLIFATAPSSTDCRRADMMV
jgi:lipopolysaccharide/colanic/teichoic acid biosynthesis glycosyltransferase